MITAGFGKELYTVNLFIFVTLYFRVLPVEWPFAAIHFRVSMACLINYNVSIKFSRRYIFAKKYLPRAKINSSRN